MPDRIPFPTSPADGDFYTDGNDLRWQYSEFKKRWSLKPLSALTSAYTTSETPPDDHELQWFDPTSGTLSIWSEDDDAWIAVSGPGADGEDLTSVAGINTVSTAAHELVTADIDKYVRLTYAGGDARTVTIPLADVSFAPVTGNIITVRNTSATTSVTAGIEALGTLNYATGANIIGPKATAQFLCVDADNDEWDIL
jgi:hypothetical protein